MTPRSEATGSWRPRPDASARPVDPDNAPTIRRSGSGSGRERVAPLPAALPRVGEALGEYELLDTIGVGGMGAVYRGLDRSLERFAAIKVLPRLPDEEGDPEDVQRFHQEARAAARLDHDGIARVFGLGRDHGFHFIAFEFIDGTNLRHLVEDRGPLTAHDAILYTLQVAAALVHAAERGVVHRDIKPSNIIITPNGRAKLVDMGLARRFEREGDEAGLTQSGTTLGSFDYISPEQARDPRDVDVRSDLYSLGCTMFHMLTGKPPFADGTVLQKLLQHQEEPPPNVRDANPAVPSGLAAIVYKLMAKDRNRRYQSPEQLGHDLLTLAADLGLRLPGFDFSGRAPAVAARGWRRPTLWAASAAAIMAVPLIAALSWIARDRVAIATLEKELLSATTVPHEARIDEGKSQEVDRSPPRLYTITNEIELATALAQAASGSTLELVGEGPFEIRRAQPVVNRDLMLKAANPSVRPVLRLGRSPSRRNGEPLPPMLQFSGGHLILDGLIFDLDTNGREETATALVADDVDLSIQRCSFRRESQWLTAGRGVALDLRGR
ncbi:MAG: serine/threonine-protein kinase, partial [Isosphaeraceae bacterium]